MSRKYTVNIIYRNREMEEICEKSYDLEEYCKTQKAAVTRLITDIEYALSAAKNGENPDFKPIRHRLLDIANNIERLPAQMRVDGKSIYNVSPAEYLAEALNKLQKA